MRPTYSPITPRLRSCTPLKNATIMTSVGLPHTISTPARRRQRYVRASTIANVKVMSPIHVMIWSGYREKPITPFRPIRTDPVKRLYLPLPVARGSRSYCTAVCGKPTSATRPRRNPCVSFRRRTSSTTRRLISRKSPVFWGMSTSATRRMTL